jgi:hypothetical protein
VTRARGTKPPPTEPIGDQANHAQPVQLGGAKRSPKLRIIPPLQLPPEWEMRAGVPRTRGDCGNEPRPCRYVECRHHLWLRLKEEQPGNPQAGKQGETTFRPSTMQSCALDVADKGGASFDEIGELLGMDSTRGRQIAQAALEKLKARGVNVDALLEAL